jgi:chromosomal replication initiation ATPase DnaA
MTSTQIRNIIIHQVCKELDVSITLLLEKNKIPQVSDARQICMALIYENSKFFSFEETAHSLGMTQANVYARLKKLPDRLKCDKIFSNKHSHCKKVIDSLKLNQS